VRNRSLSSHHVVGLLALVASFSARVVWAQSIKSASIEAAPAVAAETAASSTAEGGGLQLGASAAASEQSSAASADASASGGYLEKYPPRANSITLGAFAGILSLSNENSFRGAVTSPEGRKVTGPFSSFERPAAELGARVGYYPLAFLGTELEGMIAPAKTQTGNSATVLGARVQVVAQTPLWSITPFLAGGAGYWQIMNDASGDDTDPAFHFGGGAKFALGEHAALRVDVRDTITNQRVNGTFPHHLEVIAGADFSIGGDRPAKDSDQDSLTDDKDQCPFQAGPAPSGCPVHDTDGDGIGDPEDQCVKQPGPAPTGCPDGDDDGDGVSNSRDQCLDKAGIAPTGCPDGDQDSVLDRDDRCPTIAGDGPDGCPADADGDGLIGKDDRCPDEAETKNGFEDTDGCPDELPEAVKAFTGVIEGVQFDTGKDTIRSRSNSTLDAAVKVLTDYPGLRVSIVGHTDAQGAHGFNLSLSERRAASVKNYLVSHGIDASRIESRGAGPDEPIADNDQAEGRQKNRRIEFQILK
jgi:outer membrane protein OmpA-like peptidoglycan-associated protein